MTSLPSLWTRTLASTVIAAVIGLAAAPLDVGEASACGNVVLRQLDKDLGKLSMVEWSFNHDLPKRAFESLAYHYGKRLFTMKAGTHPVDNRALRIAALSTIRLNGDTLHWNGDEWLPTKAEQRAANLDWALSTIQAVYDQNSKDLTLQADVGEALAKSSKHHKKAIDLLASLENRDLLGSAYAYRALADMRQQLAASQPRWLRASLRALDGPRTMLEEGRGRTMTYRKLGPMNGKELNRLRALEPPLRLLGISRPLPQPPPVRPPASPPRG